jgi:hypothetical protein
MRLTMRQNILSLTSEASEQCFSSKMKQELEIVCM